jgi:hypothetical protein
MRPLESLTSPEPEKVEPMPDPSPVTVQSKPSFLKRVIDILDGVPAARPQEEGQPPRGQSMIEMAFIIPVLIVLVAGIIEIGWYANNYINLLEAAKVGARRGPFLNDNNSPLIFDAASSIAPRVASTIVDGGGNPVYPRLPSPIEVGFDASNPRNRLRGIDGPNATRCDAITNIQDYGFYNLIMCTVLESLDPLEIRFSDNYTTPEFRDDVVISVFSIQHVDNGDPGPIDPATGEPLHDIDLNAISNIDYPEGDQVIVVGRWPYNANECQSNGVNQEGRDPFDYIVNNPLDVDEGNFTSASGKLVRVPFEMSVEINDPTTGAFIDFAGFGDVGNENQRGWAYTGQHIIDEVSGYNGTCYGSEFSLPEVQDLVNLPRFIQEATPAENLERRSYLPSQGLVLVEVFWEHTLLLGTFQSRLYDAYDLFSNMLPGGSDRVIHVWAAFPAPAAEPSLLYRLLE